MIAVGATDSNQSITSYSCRGPEMTTQGLVAPGDNVMTTLSGGGWGSSGAGTSFASPAVAGLAALILSAKPAFTPLQVLATLRNSTDKIGPSTLGLASVAPAGVSMGAGRVNAFMAMRLAIRGTLADFEGKRKAIALPNPFRPADTGSVLITIPDHLAGANPRVRIYTMDGRLVRDMTGQSWDGRNGDGIPVATGTYIFLVTTEAGRATGKVTVVR